VFIHLYNDFTRSYTEGAMSDKKTMSDTVAQDVIFASIDLSQPTRGSLKVIDENKLRAIYSAAMKGPASRELSVEEAEELIRPYETASEVLKSKIGKSLHSSKP
jgi:hypothetical protein